MVQCDEKQMEKYGEKRESEEIWDRDVVWDKNRERDREKREDVSRIKKEKGKSNKKKYYFNDKY
jgi:hypothetical protein